MFRNNQLEIMSSYTHIIPLGGSATQIYWTFGDEFLQEYYTIFDINKKRIGLIESGFNP